MPCLSKFDSPGQTEIKDTAYLETTAVVCLCYRRLQIHLGKHKTYKYRQCMAVETENLHYSICIIIIIIMGHNVLPQTSAAYIGRALVSKYN